LAFTPSARSAAIANAGATPIFTANGQFAIRHLCGLRMQTGPFKMVSGRSLPWVGLRASEDHNRQHGSARKQFFFAKKNQKTLTHRVLALPHRVPQ
jgi:hypothetical protein